MITVIDADRRDRRDQRDRRSRTRDLRWIVAGWCFVVAAWATAAISGHDFSFVVADRSNAPNFAAERVVGGAGFLQAFYDVLSRDASLTGDDAVGQIPSWTGSREQRERMLADGDRKLIEGEAMVETEWLEKAGRWRLGAEAIAVAARNVPRKLERAADACVAAGDLLLMNGREGEATYRYARAITIYDLILSGQSDARGEFSDRIRRKRSVTELELQRRSGGPESANAPTRKQ